MYANSLYSILASLAKYLINKPYRVASKQPLFRILVYYYYNRVTAVVTDSGYMAVVILGILVYSI